MSPATMAVIDSTIDWSFLAYWLFALIGLVGLCGAIIILFCMWRESGQ